MVLTLLESALLIFVLRVVNVSLATIRFMMVLQNERIKAWFFAFLQALIFIFVIKTVFTDLGNWIKIIGYSAGFATGVIAGMWVEGKIAAGMVYLQIISSSLGAEITDRLGENGYGVTEIRGYGKDGAVTILNMLVSRKKVSEVQDLVSSIDPNVFITAESVRSAHYGFWQK